MKLLFDLSQSPVCEILWKWTVLLALGWTAHGLLRSRDARWRLILWRGVFCFWLALPLIQFLPLPVFQIPVHDFAGIGPATPRMAAPSLAGGAIPPATARAVASGGVEAGGGGGAWAGAAGNPRGCPRRPWGGALFRLRRRGRLHPGW